MCVDPFKVKPLNLDFGFSISDSTEKNNFQDNITRISKSIENGEKQLMKIFSKPTIKK